ncbi:MAG: hypothetical protein SV201_14080, partial [Pseudomonadota bacterium]|nr:hypothetical protein [Pseudomonadota bacterium]
DISGSLPTDWVATEYTGSTIASSNAVNAEGEYVLAITSTVLANGGGEAIHNKYKAVAGSETYSYRMYYWASVANISSKIELIWYDVSKAQISVTTIINTTNTPTAATALKGQATAPANARFVRTKVIGGVPGAGAAVGTIYFDGLDLFRAVSNAQIMPDAVAQINIAASSVGQGEIKRATANQSLSIGATGDGEITPPGGDYTHNWFAGGTRGSYAFSQYQWVSWGTRTDSSPNVVQFCNTDNSSSTAYLRSSYFQASPPYSLGYGEIPLFIQVLLDKTTLEVLGTCAAPDPAWAYHGPHNLHPVDGVIQRAVGLWGENISELVAQDRAATIEKLRQAKQIKSNSRLLQKAREDYAFTVDEKNIDMDQVPHLFNSFDPNKHVVVMLDPCSSLTEELAISDEFTGGEYNISRLLHDGRFVIDNTPLSVNRTPAGVLTVGYKWKNTGG